MKLLVNVGCASGERVSNVRCSTQAQVHKVPAVDWSMFIQRRHRGERHVRTFLRTLQARLGSQD